MYVDNIPCLQNLIISEHTLNIVVNIITIDNDTVNI